MDFKVVVLTGGDSKRLSRFMSKEILKTLVPIVDHPVLSYVLESSNLEDLIVVVEGQDVALRVGGWISDTNVDRLHVEHLQIRNNTSLVHTPTCCSSEKHS